MKGHLAEIEAPPDSTEPVATPAPNPRLALPFDVTVDIFLPMEMATVSDEDGSCSGTGFLDGLSGDGEVTLTRNAETSLPGRYGMWTDDDRGYAKVGEVLRADAQTFVRSFGAAVDGAGPALKPVLVNLLARCRPEVLADAAAALTRHGYGLALALADLAGLRPGLVIAEVNRKAVNSVNELREALKDQQLETGILLLVRDGSGARFIVLRARG